MKEHLRFAIAYWHIPGQGLRHVEQEQLNPQDITDPWNWLIR